LYSQKITY